MIKNSFKVAWRSMQKQKLFTTIKIGGFAIGIAACILISLFIIDEISYDKHYKGADQIFRIANEDSSHGTSSRWTLLGAPIRNILYEQYPEFEKVARVILWDGWQAGSNQFRTVGSKQNIYEKGFIYADPELLDILEIPMIYGESSYALTEPNSIVLSRRKAEKHFPNENPVGKQIVLNDHQRLYTVGGVMDLPSNTHLQCDFILTLEGIEFWRGEQTDWCCKNYEYYVKLNPGIDKEALEDKLLYLNEAHIVPYLEASGSVDAAHFKESRKYYLQPIENIYLNVDSVEDMASVHGIEDVVWILGVVAVFILSLACINFINLSTAKSAQRAKEVGLRKVVGSQRTHLIFQYLIESLLYSFFAVILGILISIVFLPFFNDVAGKSLSFPWEKLWFIPGVLTITLIVGIVAGIYPAVYMTAFKPIEVLKGKISQGARNSRFRSTLVVFQFTISLVLVIGAVIVSQQMYFILNKELGYNSHQVITIEATRTMGPQQKVFKEELLKVASVENVTISSYIPIPGTEQNNQDYWKEGRTKLDPGVECRHWQVDQDYMETLEIKLTKGRQLQEEIASDTSAIVINETMASLLRLEEPIGSKIYGSSKLWHVVGVVEDFHFGAMSEPIGPLGMVLSRWGGSMVITKVSTENMKETLSQITSIWDAFMPHQAIRYSFLDDRFSKTWTNETLGRIQTIFSAFAGLAIIIACLGLFALSAFTMEQRNKEISIRKVLGASFASLFGIITLDFVKLLLISFVVAIPIGWYTMDSFLIDFAYRIEIRWTVFALTGLGFLVIVLSTVSKHAIALAAKNPAETLKDE